MPDSMFFLAVDRTAISLNAGNIINSMFSGLAPPQDLSCGPSVDPLGDHCEIAFGS